MPSTKKNYDTTNENILNGDGDSQTLGWFVQDLFFWYLYFDRCMRPERQVNYVWHPFVIWDEDGLPHPPFPTLFISIVTHKENTLTSRLNQQFCIWRAPGLYPRMTPFIQRASMIFLNNSYIPIPAFSTTGIIICTPWRYALSALADTRRLLTADARVR